MKVYIAGPMSGYPEFNFPAFDAAAERLRLLGHDVINPAQMDRDLGFDPASGSITNEFMRDALGRDLAEVCRSDAIAMLPGWEKSGGARIEWMLAVYLDLKVFYL